MTKKLLLALLVAGLTGLAVDTARADTILNTGTSASLGYWEPGNPANAADVTTALNFFLTMGLNSTATQTFDKNNTQNFYRFGTTNPGPGTVTLGTQVTSSGWTDVTIAGLKYEQITGFTGYIVAKYDGGQDGDFVWYVNGGTIDLPNIDPNNGNKYALSDYTLFGTTSPIPEPASLALLGSGLAALGAALRRRKQSTAVV